MLDFDYVCERKRPSVAAMVYPFRWEIAVRWIFRSLTFGPVLNQHLLQSCSLFFSYILKLSRFNSKLFVSFISVEITDRSSTTDTKKLWFQVGWNDSILFQLWRDSVILFYCGDHWSSRFLVGALKSGWSGRFSKSKLEYWVLFYCCLVISDFRGVRGSGTTCFLLSSQPAGV